MEKKNVSVAMMALAVLFQPFFKIALGRSLWNIVDVAVAAFLIILIYRCGKGNFDKQTNLKKK